MFQSWYDRHEEKTRFWLQFQVAADGFEDGSGPANLNLPGQGPQQIKPNTVDANNIAEKDAPTFHLFENLPIELRLQIWEITIRPRIVIAACVDSRTQAQKAAQLAERPRRRATPALLHVCRETRELALRHYELAFAWKIPHRLCSAESGALPGGGEARVWFNYQLDALLLMGELEPFDRYGFNSPMVHFLREENTMRVRHVACAFEELRLGLHESELIFGCLFHIIDRFPSAKRLLISSTPQDLEVRHLALPTSNNVVQKLWWAYINGSSMVNSMANTQILMIMEDELLSFIQEKF